AAAVFLFPGADPLPVFGQVIAEQLFGLDPQRFMREQVNPAAGSAGPSAQRAPEHASEQVLEFPPGHLGQVGEIGSGQTTPGSGEVAEDINVPDYAAGSALFQLGFGSLLQCCGMW